MKRSLAFFTVLLLSGCVSYSAQVQNGWQQSFDRERMAWMNAQPDLNACKQRYQDKSGHVPRKASMAFFGCSNKVREAEVLPYSTAPDFFWAMENGTMQNAMAYRDGKISREEVNAKNQALWQEYTSKSLARAQMQLNSAMQMDQQADLQQRAALQNFGQAMLIQSTRPPPPMQTTHCQMNTITNSMDCTTN